MALQIKITNAGRAEIINAENTGTDPVTITQIGLGTGQYTPSATQTALVSEFKRLSTFGGTVVADDIINIAIRDDSSDVYEVSEFGLYTASGTLLAVYSAVGVPFFDKSAQSVLLLAVDIKLTTLDAASLTFGDLEFVNPPATATVRGVVELATDAEGQAGIDTERAVTPAVMRADSSATNTANRTVRRGASGEIEVGAITALGRVRAESTAKQVGLTYPGVATWNPYVDASGNFRLDRDGTEFLRVTTAGKVLIGTTTDDGVHQQQVNGLISAQTPPLFDNDTSVATTAFVKRAVGNYSDVVILSGSVTLTAADSGKYFFLNANNISVTMPDPATVPLGWKVAISQSSSNTGGQILAAGGVTLLNVTGLSIASPLVMQARSCYEVFATTSSAYHVAMMGGMATEGNAGIAELATNAEVQAGTDTERTVTPAGLTARTATETRTGIAELATNAEVQAGTDTARIVTPAGLASRTATETRTGVVELATIAEGQTGTDTERAVTPAVMRADSTTSNTPNRVVRRGSNGFIEVEAINAFGRVRSESTTKQLGLVYPGVATWNFFADPAGNIALDRDNNEYLRVMQSGRVLINTTSDDGVHQMQVNGMISAQTPAIFDNDTSVATTAFVKRSQGNYSDVVILSSSVTLTAADAGKYFYLNANNISVTMPNPATVPLGWKVSISQSSSNTGGQILAAGGISIISISGSAIASPVAMQNSSQYEITSVTSSAYHIIQSGGAVSRAASGYQMLPSGIIMQWVKGPIAGAETTSYPNVTFPIAFPTACLSVQVSTQGNDTLNADQIFQVSSFTTTTVKLFPQWFGSGTQGLVYPFIFAI